MWSPEWALRSIITTNRGILIQNLLMMNCHLRGETLLAIFFRKRSVIRL